MWLIIAEIGIFGIIPAIILITPKFRERNDLLIIGALMNVIGIVLNRFVFSIQTLAIPVMPFDKFMSYFPTWQEWGIAIGSIGYGILLFSLSYRLLRQVRPSQHKQGLHQDRLCPLYTLSHYRKIYYFLCRDTHP